MTIQKRGRPCNTGKDQVADRMLMSKIADLIVERKMSETEAIRRLNPKAKTNPSTIRRIQRKFKDKRQDYLTDALTRLSERSASARPATAQDVKQYVDSRCLANSNAGPFGVVSDLTRKLDEIYEPIRRHQAVIDEFMGPIRKHQEMIDRITEPYRKQQEMIDRATAPFKKQQEAMDAMMAPYKKQQAILDEIAGGLGGIDGLAKRQNELFGVGKFDRIARGL